MRYLLPGRRELSHPLLSSDPSIVYYLDLDTCHMSRMCNRATSLNFYRTQRSGWGSTTTPAQKVLRVRVGDIMPIPLRKWCRTLENLDRNGIYLT